MTSVKLRGVFVPWASYAHFYLWLPLILPSPIFNFPATHSCISPFHPFFPSRNLSPVVFNQYLAAPGRRSLQAPSVTRLIF